MQGDPLAPYEVSRVLRPISKEAGKRNFDVWFARRTTAMQAVLDRDRSTNEVMANWVHCYESLNEAQRDKVIMLMLDELLEAD